MLTSSNTKIATRKDERAKALFGFLKNYNSINTRLAYKEDLKKFLKFLISNFQITEFLAEHAHFVAYKGHLLEQEYSPSSINRMLASASAYIDYLFVEGLRKDNPFLRVKRFKEDHEGKTVAIPTEELIKAISEINKDTLTGKFRFALCKTFFNSGMRVSALCNLKLKNLIVDQHGVALRFQDKGEKHLTVYLDPETVDAIKEYLKVRQLLFGQIFLNDHLFISFSRNSKGKLHRSSVNYIFNEIFRELEIFGISPHSARATFITESIRREGISVAQNRVGHGNPATTEKYNCNKNQGSFKII